MTGAPDGEDLPGLWLRRQREAAHLTQEELAGRSGLSVRSISNLERRITRPYPRSLRLVMAALGSSEITAEELIAWYKGGHRGPSARPGHDRPAEPGTAPHHRPASGGSARAIVPRELPTSVAHFAGRTAELAVLDRWLEEAAEPGREGTVVISAIGGMAGVGKTALALRWAHQVAGRFPDGQLYVNLRGYDPGGQPADTAGVVRRFLDALGVTADRIPPDTEGQTGLYRTLLAGQRMLIVADNARDAAQVRPLLPASAGSLVLVTSRGQLAGLAAADDARVLNLDVPTAAEASAMLAARLGAARVAAEPAAAAELIRACGQLPLALAIVAARAAGSGWPLASLAAELASASGRLDVLGNNDCRADVQTVFSWSCQQLSATAARMFALLSIHPGPDICAPAAASLAGLTLPHARAALRDLASVSLIAERAPGRYTLHDLLRAYAAGEALASRTAAERDAAAHRMLDHYLHTAEAAARTLDPARENVLLGPPAPGVTPEHITCSEQALSWFGTERKILLSLTRHAEEPRYEDYARQLPWIMMTFLDRGCHWPDLITVHETALACAQRHADLPGQGCNYLGLGRAYLRMGQAIPARTHLTRAARLARRLGDQAMEARAHIALCVAAELQQRHQEALASSLRAIELAERACDQVLLAKACNNAGYEYAMLGQTGPAFTYCQRALGLYRHIGNPVLEANTWDSFGYIYYRLGDHHNAAASYQRAIGLFDIAGARYQSARTLDRLGDSHYASGDASAARNAWQQALAILEHPVHPEAAQIRGKLREAAPPEGARAGAAGPRSAGHGGFSAQDARRGARQAETRSQTKISVSPGAIERPAPRSP